MEEGAHWRLSGQPEPREKNTRSSLRVFFLEQRVGEGRERRSLREYDQGRLLG
jgi:hypothetical protein